MGSDTTHISVLLEASIDALHVHKNGKYIDATLGAGGHSEEILKRGGEVLAIEADSHMIAVAEERLKKYCPTLVHGNFENIASIAKANGFEHADGVIMDLGISNLHYEVLGRGFSFRKSDEPLDMRLSTDSNAVTGATLLNVLSEKQLIQLFEPIIGAQKAHRAVKSIVRQREQKQFETVSDLEPVVRENSAEVFLALRIAVNSEFESLEKGIRGAVGTLKSGGVISVISFHSLEDKLVARIFREFEKKNIGIIETKNPIVPTQEEVDENPKSRSALLRVLKKI